MTSREKQILSETVDILKRDLHPSKVILFGSRAKKKSISSSDFDFAVDCPAKSGNTRQKVKDHIDEAAGLYNVDVVYLNELDPQFKQIVLDTGKVVYEKRA